MSPGFLLRVSFPGFQWQLKGWHGLASDLHSMDTYGHIPSVGAHPWKWFLHSPEIFVESSVTTSKQRRAHQVRVPVVSFLFLVCWPLGVSISDAKRWNGASDCIKHWNHKATPCWNASWDHQREFNRGQGSKKWDFRSIVHVDYQYVWNKYIYNIYILSTFNLECIWPKNNTNLGFPWNKGISLTKRCHLGFSVVFEVAIIWPDVWLIFDGKCSR